MAGEKEASILTINGGSSSIKFAVYDLSDPPVRRFSGQIEGIGKGGIADFQSAVKQVVSQVRTALHGGAIAGIGHRVVHGGLHLLEHQIITGEVIAKLREAQPLDLPHLPWEIDLIEAFGDAFSDVPQVACFDTAFHRELPRVAAMLPIPRTYWDAGVRRFGFHGLSYTYLMNRLAQIAGADAANGRIILAHLGTGASMAAVHRGKPVDTTMAFTPTAGLVMGTRPGDIDPGLLTYLMRSENLTPDQMDEFISHRCGLLGISQTTSDMRDLLNRRANDQRAADAVDTFCYQAKKFIGAFAAAMGGLDTLVFSGGIGEHASEIRAQICEGMHHLGISIEPAHNQSDADVISAANSQIIVRVIPTDEQIIMAQIVRSFVNQP